MPQAFDVMIGDRLTFRFDTPACMALPSDSRGDLRSECL